MRIKKHYIFLALLFISITGYSAQERGVIKQGDKYWIGYGTYFTCSFVKKPVLGISILRVQIFDKNGNRNNDYNITGMSGMPAMHAHDYPETEFKQNKKYDYIFPVNIVMPGEWEVKIKITKKQIYVFRGIIKFEVK
jgi:hypothetical protein